MDIRPDLAKLQCEQVALFSFREAQTNLAYLVNYDEREKAGKPYTSQAAESHVDALINARHKRKQKMQWTREGVVFKTKADDDAEHLTLSRASFLVPKLELLQLTFPSFGLETRSGGINVSNQLQVQMTA